MTLEVKICGVSTLPAVEAAVDGGARFVGFVFFPRSPRFVTVSQAAALVAAVPAGVAKVGLVVDADDETLAEIVETARLDLLQLHGKETPARVAEIRNRFGLPVMKAVAIAEAADVDRARAYENVADRLLFDAKPPKGATRPGGNALAFDWELIAGQSWHRPWMLAGGLDADNVEEAVRVSGASAVDVSSGVEDASGAKNPEKIRAFLAAATRCQPTG